MEVIAVHTWLPVGSGLTMSIHQAVFPQLFSCKTNGFVCRLQWGKKNCKKSMIINRADTTVSPGSFEYKKLLINFSYRNYTRVFFFCFLLLSEHDKCSVTDKQHAVCVQSTVVT